MMARSASLAAIPWMGSYLSSMCWQDSKLPDPTVTICVLDEVAVLSLTSGEVSFLPECEESRESGPCFNSAPSGWQPGPGLAFTHDVAVPTSVNPIGTNEFELIFP